MAARLALVPMRVLSFASFLVAVAVINYKEERQLILERTERKEHEGHKTERK